MVSRVGTVCRSGGGGAVGWSPAVGQFELKTLGSEPGGLEFQSQNAYSWGQPHRQVSGDPGDLECDDNTIIRRAARARNGDGADALPQDAYRHRVPRRSEVDEPGSIYDADSFDALKLGEVGAEVHRHSEAARRRRLGLEPHQASWSRSRSRSTAASPRTSTYGSDHRDRAGALAWSRPCRRWCISSAGTLTTAVMWTTSGTSPTRCSSPMSSRRRGR